MWYAGLTLFLLAAAGQHEAAVGTAKQSPQTYWPFVLSLVLAAVSSEEPHPYNRRLQKDVCNFDHYQPPGSLLFGDLPCSDPSTQLGNTTYSFTGKRLWVIQMPQWEAQADLVCGPGRNNPTPNMLNKRWLGLKGKGTVVPTLSSASNHTVVTRYSQSWPSASQASSAGHRSPCSRCHCCHIPAVSTQPCTAPTTGCRDKVTWTSRLQDSKQRIWVLCSRGSLFPSMGSHNLLSRHAGPNLRKTLTSSYAVWWPHSIVLVREIFSSCRNQTIQLRK